MTGINSGFDTNIVKSPEPIINIVNEKAKTYANDLVNNNQRLKDPNHCNLIYGAFVGSEGDYSFHQRLAFENIATNTKEIIVNHSAPESIEEHANWFVNSILNGNAEETRNAILARKNFNYETGTLFRTVQKISEKSTLSPDSSKSICEVFKDMTQMVDHNLPYHQDGQKGNINIIFSQKAENNLPQQESVSNKETIHFGDPLPEHYQIPLDEIKKVAPNNFVEQATRLAYYFHSLDTNQELFDINNHSLQTEVNNMADTIAELPSIGLVYVFDSLAKGGSNLGSIPPEKSLPEWITSRKKSDVIETSPQGIPQASDFYKKYAPQYGISEQHTNGEYFYYKNDICPEKGSSPADIFKSYLEKDIPKVKMDTLFKDFREQKIHPHSSKLFEGDRIVLYWNTYLSDEISNKLKQVFQKNDVPYRGFGQDSIGAEIDSNGNWKFKTIYSSDQSRGEAGGAADFSHTEYTPKKFFELYLQQMFKHFRNPLDPYKMSFVPIINEGNSITNSEALKTQIDNIKKRGLDVIQYEKRMPYVF